MKCRYVAMITVLAVIAGAVLVHMVTPASVGPLGILAFFVCLYVATTSGCYLMMVAARRVVLHVATRGAHHSLAAVTPLKLYYYASIVGLIPVILLGMQSIGGITAWDILLLTLFLGLGCFYIHKRF